MPHHLLRDNTGLAVASVIVSALLSLWALYLDPVINMDGILYVEAAEHFSRGQWAAGLGVYKWPFYSFIIGAVSAATGMAEGHAAYLVNACLYAATVLGFVAFAKVLGGDGRVLWLAAAVALLHPDLNAFRSFVIRDVGYWACYLWSLAFYLAYIRSGRPPLLLAGLVLGLAAFLFRIEGIVLLTVIPACIHAWRSADRNRSTAVLVLAALATGAAVAVAPLWHYVSAIQISTGALLETPLHHIADSWRSLGSEIDARLQALQWEFPGATSRAVTAPVYLLTVLAMTLVELIETVGVVFSGLIIYAFHKRKRFMPRELRAWWWLMVGLQVLLVLQFTVSSFFLAKRYPVALALTLLPIVPFLLDDIWTRCRRAGLGRSGGALAIAVLIAIESLDGLDVSTRKHYIKDAGLWLQAHAPAGSTVYSNNRILIHYSGLQEGRPDVPHTWHAAMREIWTGDWRRYDYFALDMAASKQQHEVLLFRQVDTRPIRSFRNDRGDRVLIFRPE